MKLWVLLLLCAGHLVTDIHQGAIPLMLPYLRDTFELSYFAVGGIVLVANLSSSIIQPLFGMYSDKKNIPWILPLGVAAAAIGVALIGIMPSYPLVLVAVFISGLGIAAYHPEGSKMAHFASGVKRGKGMSIFSVGGNLGFAIGPLLGAMLLERWGLIGSLGFLGPGLVMAVILYLLMPRMLGEIGEAKDAWQLQREWARQNSNGKRVWSWGLALLMVVVVVRSWVHFGLVTYIPLYYLDYLGGDPMYSGMLLFILLGGGAIGTLLGGQISDYIGPKAQLCLSMAMMVPLLYLFLNTSGVVNLLIIGLAGMTLISTFATTVVMGQQYLPNNIGLASGLLLGFSIGTGGLGVPILGIIADNHGLPLVMSIISLLPIAGLALALFLPAPPLGEHQTN